MRRALVRTGVLVVAAAVVSPSMTLGGQVSEGEAAIQAERPAGGAVGEVRPEAEYVIQDGDVLGIKFFFNPELNEEVTVRPDGRISLQLVPEIVAAGRTPLELTRELKDLYSQELDSPEISVIVRTFSAQRVYVDGEVEQPGVLELIDGLTALGAIARAEGFTDRARAKQVLIIRRQSDGTPLVRELNVRAAHRGTHADLMLRPYDIVYVPMTKIANVNKWIDQYIRKSLPVSFGFRIDIVD